MNQRCIETILVMIKLEPHNLEAIRQAAPEARLITFQHFKEFVEKIDEIMPQVEVVLGNPTMDRTLFPRVLNAPRLRWIQQRSAGVNWLMDYPELAENDLIITNASGVHAVPVSEHIFALMFCLARDLHHCIREQIQHKWNMLHPQHRLEGKTMGLIGVGRIGEKTAERAKGIKMKVLGLRRNPERSSPWVDQMYGPDGLLEILSQADWVVITAPLTRETKAMFGEREFRAMKKSAYIINIARGAIIQENVLIQALQEGWMAGAGLDVFEKEPLPTDSPLWDMENVVITAHWAGWTDQYDDLLVQIFTDNLRRYQAGQPLINLVDKRLGY